MENVLVTGCSFTQDDYEPIVYKPIKSDPLISWPHLINPDWNIVNVALSGISNQEMIERAIDAITAGDIKKRNFSVSSSHQFDRVIVGLTQWGRIKTPKYTVNLDLFFSLRYNPLIHNKDNHFIHVDAIRKYFIPGNGYNIKEFVREMNNSKAEERSKWNQGLPFLRNLLFMSSIDHIGKKFVESFIDSTLRSIITLREICHAKKIKLHVFDILEGWDLVAMPSYGVQHETIELDGLKIGRGYDALGQSKEQYNWFQPYMSYYMKRSPLYNNLKKSKTPVDLIRFPFITELADDGKSCCATGPGEEWEKYKLSPLDPHPSQKGYQKIADFFNEHFRDYKI